MNFNNKLVFCAIPSPQNNKKYLVFVAPKGSNVVDDSFCSNPDYEILVQLLNDKGLEEIDSCSFETKDAIKNKKELEILLKNLVKLGIKYSKPLEFNIMSEFQILNQSIIFDFLPFKNNLKTDNSLLGLDEFVVKNKVPGVGEKIKLNFYLFLQCVFQSENNVFLELVGDLYSKENTNFKNFLQITSSDFVRIDSGFPQVIILQSVKTYADFLKEINFLYKGNFKYVKHIIDPEGRAVVRTKEFHYNILEIKKHINPSLRIVVEVNLNKYYDDMILMSKKIKREKSNYKKTSFDISNIKSDMNELKERLSSKMLNFAEMDEFEKAENVKKDIVFIDNKMQFVDSLDKKVITQEEYLKNFCLNN
jgi:hypothetical protein